MVPVGLGNFEEDTLGGGVGFGGIIGSGLHFADDGVFGVLESVVDVELTIFGVVGVEGEAEEAFFELFVDEGAVGEVEEGGFFGGAAVFGEDGDFAELLDEEESVGFVGGDGEGDGEFDFLLGEGGGEFDLGGGEEGGGCEEETGEDGFHGWRVEGERSTFNVERSTLKLGAWLGGSFNHESSRICANLWELGWELLDGEGLGGA